MNTDWMYTCQGVLQWDVEHTGAGYEHLVYFVAVGKEEGKDEKKDPALPAAPAGLSFGKPGSAQGKRTLQNVNTHIYVGTEVSTYIQLVWVKYHLW